MSLYKSILKIMTLTATVLMASQAMADQANPDLLTMEILIRQLPAKVTTVAATVTGTELDIKQEALSGKYFIEPNPKVTVEGGSCQLTKQGNGTLLCEKLLTMTVVMKVADGLDASNVDQIAFYRPTVQFNFTKKDGSMIQDQVTFDINLYQYITEYNGFRAARFISDGGHLNCQGSADAHLYMQCFFLN